MKPEGRTDEKRVKTFRKHTAVVLVELLKQVDTHRPRIIVGEGQGAVVVAMSAFPMILERSCRDKAFANFLFPDFASWALLGTLAAASTRFSFFLLFCLSPLFVP